jgi:hypothetical protein
MTRTLAACLFVLLAALPARAHFALFHRPVPVRAAYYPAPILVTPLPQPIAVLPCPEITPLPVPPPPAAAVVPGPAAIPFVPPLSAPPQSAPPSTGPLPPTPTPGPVSPPAVKEDPSTSSKVATAFYEAFPTANAAPCRIEGRLPVTFWNLSGAAMSLRVAGQDRRLGQGQSLTLDLTREFEWRVEGHEALVSRVPDGEKGLTLLIRR